MTSPGIAVTQGTPRARRRARFWDGVDRLGAKAWALVGVGLFVVGAGWLLSQIGWLLLPAGFGLLVGVLTAPLVSWLQRRHVPRLAATVIVFVVVTLAAVLLIMLVVPPFVLQASKLVEGIPESLAGFVESVQDFERRLATSNPAAGRAAEGFGQALQDRAVELADDLSGAAVTTVQTVITFSLAGLLGALVAFLAVKDLPRYTAPVTRWLRRPGRERLAGAASQLRQTATGFIRGQLLLGTVVGVLSGVAMGLLGVPFPVPLGVISGVGELIPSVGPILAGIPAVILAWGEGGPTLALFAALALLVIQQAESYFLVPLVVGNAVQLPALAVMVVLLVAGGAFGLVGMIVAVPLVAMARDALAWFWMDDADVATALAGAGQATARPERRRRRSHAERRARLRDGGR